MKKPEIVDKEKQKMYATARKEIGCTQGEWAWIFNMGEKKGQSHVSDKERGARGVNMPEALASELLKFLHSNGYDVKNIEFDKNGSINNIPLF